MKLDIQDLVMDTSFIKNLEECSEIIIDNSTFLNLDACFVKGLFGGLLKKQRTDGSIHLDWGGAVHEGLQAKFEGKSIDEQIAAAESHDSWPLIAEASHHTKTQESVRSLLRSYHIHTETTPNFQVLNFEGEPCIEQSFSLKLGEFQCINGGKTITVYWQGKIDAIGFHQHNPWVVDHKTTQQMGERFVDTFLRSSQMLGYQWAANNLAHEGLSPLTLPNGTEVDLRKTPTKGVLINALCVRKNGFEFKVHQIPIPYTRLEEWRIETLERLKFFVKQIEEWHHSGIATPTREHCVTKYGRCPFFDVCEMPPSKRREAIESSMYKTSTWSPLE